MTLQFGFRAVASFVCRDDQNVFHVLCAELKRQMRFAVFLFFFSSSSSCGRLKHLMGFLSREVEIREETDCVHGPMPRSHFTFNLRQALF